MRRLSIVAFLASIAFGVGAPARADDKDDAKAIIEKAIKALGGEDKLGKFKASTWKGKGKVYIMKDVIEYTGKWAAQSPDRFSVAINADYKGTPFKQTQVLDGDKAYIKMNDEETMTRDKDGVAESRREYQLAWVPTTILPLRDKSYKLQTLGDEKIGDTIAAGLKVTGADGKHFRIYFDKKTGLPLKVEAKVKTMGGDEELDHEWLFSDYKEIQGVKRAMKLELRRDGKKFIEQTISDVKLAEKLDDKLFAKP
jgi:hypothetical protein